MTIREFNPNDINNGLLDVLKETILDTETKNNEIIPVHPKSKLDEMNSGNKVDFDIVEEDNNGMGYTETYEIIKYAKIL